MYVQLIVVPNKTFQLESFGITDIGRVREHNEDAWAAYPDHGLFILADGMGGHSAGEIASKEAVTFLYAYVKKWIPSQKISIEEAKAFFKEAYSEVNSRIYEKGEQDQELKGMGTTLCSLFFLQKRVIVAHVGDSRIYRLRKSKLEPLTEDHSLVCELLALEAIQPEEVEAFPYKHILTRAIGTHPRVASTINSADVEPHDLFMLCSDGLSNYVPCEQMEEILTTDASLSHKGQALVDLAMEQGGGDNVTLILVDTSNEPISLF
jgi:PPM family protein phosphatase